MKRTASLATLMALLLAGCAALAGDARPMDPARERVVLLHGFGRSTHAMGRLADRLEDAGYHVEPIGYSSLTQDMAGIQQEVFAKIDACCAHATARIHFVGHSLGGLLARAYLQMRNPAQLGNVVLLGSPSRGTEVVDHYRDSWYFSLAGPAVESLGTQGSPFLENLGPPSYNLGVIAGDTGESDNEQILPGRDDGLVRVESTRVEGMKDFLVVRASHWGLRGNDEVARQVIHFLRAGRFDHR